MKSIITGSSHLLAAWTASFACAQPPASRVDVAAPRLVVSEACLSIFICRGANKGLYKVPHSCLEALEANASEAYEPWPDKPPAW
jgi:hypothetical protein